MDTNNPPGNPSSSRKESAQMRKRAKWARNQQAQRLLEYYGLSLDGLMPAPLFGVQQFTLSVYNEQREKTPQLMVPYLDSPSQDLGFVEGEGFEAIKNLKTTLNIDDRWVDRLLDDALERGKQELKRYLRHLRPLLIDR